MDIKIYMTRDGKPTFRRYTCHDGESATWHTVKGRNGHVHAYKCPLGSAAMPAPRPWHGHAQPNEDLILVFPDGKTRKTAQQCLDEIK